jgi:hypothetical protein
MIKYISIVLLVALLFFIEGTTHCADVADFSIYKTLFFKTTDDYSPEHIKTSQFPKLIQDRIKTYKDRWKRFRSKLRAPISPPESVMGFPRFVSIEKGIVSLINAKGIEDIAANYAKNARLYLEWEGSSSGPLDEAKFAEDYLKQNARSPLKPYLLLFLVHRYRVAYECLDYEKNYRKQAEATLKYHQYLKEARNESDPLVGLIADDVDKQTYLYIKTEKHP